MESHPIPAKHSRISIEESAIEQRQKPEEMGVSPQKRWLCNELVWELCREIPIVNIRERILLTSQNIYVYLAPRFSEKLIYRDAIVFLKAKLNAKKGVQIWIDQTAHNNESEPIQAINQKQSDNDFKLGTNKFHVNINSWNETYPTKVQCSISIDVSQFECAHLQHFLRLIAPLVQPIRLRLDSYSSIPIEEKAHFSITQSDWIDSIQLWDSQFDSEPIYETLSEYNKLQINGTTVDVPKMIHWLTTNNNSGQLKKCLFLGQGRLDDALALLKLIEEVKKEFVCATSKSPFVVRFGLNGEQLDEFTLGNELTGERLQLRRKKVKYGRYIHALSRSPDNELDANQNYCAELDTCGTEINLPISFGYTNYIVL